MYKYLIAVTIALAACDATPTVLSDSREATLLPDLWYQGKAEVSTYELSQNRYNDVHPGKMTTVFVTEDFLTDKQVKNDGGKSTNSVSILKMNKIRRFTTGLYDYSLFTSVFTDVKQAHTYKVASSSQDWCGQSYMQINRDKLRYDVQLRSYFEGESTDKEVTAELTEDELPVILKLDDSKLPVGSLTLLPSLEYTLLRHVTYEPVKAIGKKDTAVFENDGYDYADTVYRYTVTIPSHSRTISYYYSGESNRQILMWEDEYPSAFDGKLRTTRASLLHSEWLPYWSLNTKADSSRRQPYGLSDF